MLLLIDGYLCEPPSEPTLFRDITLHASTFKDKSVILECQDGLQDFYYQWLKSRGAFDFVKDILPYNQESGFTIRYKYGEHKGDLFVRRIGYHNFDKIINLI